MADSKRRLRALDEFDRSSYPSLANVKGGVRRGTMRWWFWTVAALVVAVLVGVLIGYLAS